MSEVSKVTILNPAPGIQRDGTAFDTQSLTYVDGEWMRFQRGRPRKIGGYRLITNALRGPISEITVYPIEGKAKVLTFSPSGIESLITTKNGVGSTPVSRTPVGFVTDSDFIWTSDTMWDDAVGADNALVLAVAAPAMSTIDSDTDGKIYSGLVSDDTTFVELSGLTARGVFVTQPYAVYFGANGKVTWSNQNEPLNVTTGDAGSDRIAGTNIVAGIPLASGSGPGGLLWSLTSVIRMEYVGGMAVFRFSKLTSSSTIISQKSPVELDGVYYWIGEDRFLVSDGQSVQTLPNNTNINWFFDNVNRNYLQKIWGEVNPRFNEIIWHFPYGDSTICNKTIVYNVSEKCWYDYSLERSAGSFYKGHPILSEDTSCEQLELELEPIEGCFGGAFEETAFEETAFNMCAFGFGTFEIGTVIRGVDSGAIYKIVFVDGDIYHVKKLGSECFYDGEVVINKDYAEANILSGSSLCSLYLHEYGTDYINGSHQLAIQSSFTLSNSSLLGSELNRWTRLLRIEPDFIQSGDMDLIIQTKEFANSPVISSDRYTFNSSTEKIDTRIQGRLIYLKFVSNTTYGDYQLGRTLLHMEPGDIRS